MSQWININDWKPPLDKFVYTYNYIRDTHEICCLKAVKHKQKLVELWHDRYGNVCWPSHWTLLKDTDSLRLNSVE